LAYKKINKGNCEFSIIIPTYNRYKLLKKCLNSVLNQNYKEFEIIIVDNYSSDESEAYIRSMQKIYNNIKYYRYLNNNIVAASRNYGVSNANGKYVCFLDSDDTWHSNKLEAVNKKLYNKKYDLIYHSVNIETTKKKVLYKKIINGRNYTNKKKYDILINGNKIITSSVVMRRNIFLQLKGFNEDKEIVCCEDLDLWIRLLALTNNIYYIHKPLGNYLSHEGNLSKKSMYLPFNKICRKYSKDLNIREKRILYSRKIYIGSLYKSKKFLLYAIINGGFEIKSKILIKYIIYAKRIFFKL
jgi:glycosyltransferase involved in cell wall biosynthesis